MAKYLQICHEQRRPVTVDEPVFVNNIDVS